MSSGSAPPDVIHHGSLLRSVAALFVIGATGSVMGAVLAAGVLSALSRPTPDINFAIIYVAAYTLSFTLSCAIAEYRRPSEVRFTADGIQLTAARRDGVFIPWPVVSGARIRRVWPLTMLDVTVAAPDTAHVVLVDRDRRAPIRRRRRGTVRFSMPLVGLGVSTATLRAELGRRGFRVD